VTGREFSDGGDRTGLGLSPRDFDLLADYLGGALADTPAETEVARRIQQDPVWHRAHSALAEAIAAVGADLDAWGGAPEPMPVDVAARLTAALAGTERPGLAPGAAGEPGEDAAGVDEDAEPSGVGAGRGRLSVVPGPSAAPRRRWVRWAGPLAAAAAFVGAIGLGLQVLPQVDSGSDDAASTSGGSADRAPENGPAPVGAPAQEDRASLLAALPVRQLVASGADYRRDNLAASRLSPQTFASDDWRTAADPPVVLAQANVPAALRRLTAPAALSACLAAIGGEHPRPAAMIMLVDFASFEGSPALLVVFTDSAGERWAWATGPDCGLGNTGADARYRVKVG
jgi:hypothetical protein